MKSTIHAAHRGGHLSRHERQELARAVAFSRRTARISPPASLAKLASQQLEFIDRVVREDRTPVSTALLAIAGMGASEVQRRVVLERLGDAACLARAEGEISSRRADQIARHVMRALAHDEQPLAA